MKEKKALWYILVLVMSVALALLFPSNIGAEDKITSVDIDHEKSLIVQKISSLTMDPQTVTKIYYRDQLIGVLLDAQKLDDAISMKQQEIDSQLYNDYSIRLSSDVYTVTERTFMDFENRDDEIIQYLDEHNLFRADTTRIDFIQRGEEEKIVDTIYVQSVKQFSEALREFVLMFVDEDVFFKLDNGEVIPDLTTFGTQDVDVYIQEKIKSTPSDAVVTDIFTNKEDILNYLCYGRGNTAREYYTVEPFDTVQGVASRKGLSARQLIMLNESIDSISTALSPGQQLNITKFSPPINVVVETQVFRREIIYPEPALYIKDDTLETGTDIIEVEEKLGYEDVLYTEVYINGSSRPVSSKINSETVVEAPVQGVHRIGSHYTPYNGAISFGLPCEHAVITCDYYGYAGHTGVDFINPYSRYGDVLAVTNGTIITNAYSSAAGNYYRIDAGMDEATGYHFVLRYGHMNRPGFFPVGETVSQGMIIGQIGNTGRSTGPHVHVSVYVDGQQVDPCIYLPCELCPRY